MKNIWDVNWEKNKSTDVHPELVNLVEKNTRGRKVLEVGFGTGGDLEELSKKGFDCYGIETSKIAFQRAKKSRNFKAFYQNGEETSFNDGEFDLIFHQGVLEHFRAPKKLLREHYRLLKADGLVVIDVPHKWNLFTVYKNIRMFFGNWYGGWERSYTTRELKSQLSKNYFDVVEIKYRGIWPHQWGKFLYPERIVKKKWAKRLIFSFPFKQFRWLARKLYDSLPLVRLLSAYNITVVARKRRIRIGFDARYAEGDLVGVGKYIKFLIIELSGLGVECVLFYSQRPKFEIKGNNVRQVFLKNKNRYMFEQILLPRALIRNRIDLYHAPGNVGIPLFCSVPSILTVHDIIPIEVKGYYSYSPLPFVSQISHLARLKTSLSRAKKVVTDSDYVCKQLVKVFRVLPFKISTISLGAPEVVRVTKLPKELVGEKYILNHGGIDIRKNLDRHVKAFSLVQVKHPNLKLVITGENKRMRAELNVLIKKLGLGSSVIFTGYVTDSVLSAIVKNADAICYPSLSEGFGFPVLEGFGAGVPVISSNTSSIPEIAGDGALLVNPNNVDEIAEAIIKVLGDKKLRERMVLKGKEQYNKFSWKKAANEYLRLYNSL